MSNDFLIFTNVCSISRILLANIKILILTDYSFLLTGHSFSNFWSNTWKPIDESLISQRRDTNFNVDYGDLCLGQLAVNCTIDDTCWQLMTDTTADDQQLTYQFLYFKNGQKFGCQPALSQKLDESNFPPFARQIDRICANMFDVNRLISNANYPIRDRDLFMTNSELHKVSLPRISTLFLIVFYCGAIGYTNFVNNRRWQEAISRWQLESGCYGEIKTAYQLSRSGKFQIFDHCHDHVTSVALGAHVSIIGYYITK